MQGLKGFTPHRGKQLWRLRGRQGLDEGSRNLWRAHQRSGISRDHIATHSLVERLNQDRSEACHRARMKTFFQLGSKKGYENGLYLTISQ